MFDYSHIKYRNMFLQPFLVVFTLGIYLFYWFHVTLAELHRANGRGPEVGRWRWTLLACIPLLHLIALWHYVGEYSEFVRGRFSRGLLMVLATLFFPALWFLAQMDLNRAARFHG